MKSAILTGVLLLAAARLSAADHPTVLLLHRDGKDLPVVGVKGTDPIVEVDGKKKRIGDNLPISAERAPYYADGFVELSSVSLAGLQFVTVATIDAVGQYLEVNDVPQTGFFDADLRPSVEVRGGFVVLIAFAPEFLDGRTDKPSAEVVVHDLPTLPAGVKTHVKFVHAGTRGGRYLVLVFADGGAELKTNLAPSVARYFSRIERVRLAAAVAKYRDSNRDMSHEAMPVLQIRPALPAGIAAPTHAITATVSVGADGAVDDVDVAGAEDPLLEASIRDSMSGWLFLPRLKAGVPTAARVAVPLRFAATEKK